MGWMPGVSGAGAAVPRSVVLLGAPLPPPAPPRPAAAASRTPRPLVEQPQTPCLSPWVPLSAVLAPPRRRVATHLQTKCAVRWHGCRAPRVAGCQAQTGHGCLGQSADKDGISEMAQSRWLAYRRWLWLTRRRSANLRAKMKRCILALCCHAECVCESWGQLHLSTAKANDLHSPECPRNGHAQELEPQHGQVDRRRGDALCHTIGNQWWWWWCCEEALPGAAHACTWTRTADDSVLWWTPNSSLTVMMAGTAMRPVRSASVSCSATCQMVCTCHREAVAAAATHAGNVAPSWQTRAVSGPLPQGRSSLYSGRQVPRAPCPSTRQCPPVCS